MIGLRVLARVWSAYQGYFATNLLEDSNLNYRYDNLSDLYIIFHDRKCVVVSNRFDEFT